MRAPAGQPARRSAPISAPLERGLVLGALDALGSLASHGAIDRLIRGRIWIGVIAFALIGIVTLQLLVLQLNANIGRALVRVAQLQRENAALSIEGSELAGGERVEAQAARLGMQLVPVGSLRFLTSYPPADIAHAAAALNTPVHTAASGTEATTTAGSGVAAGAASSAGTVESSQSAEATGTTGEAAPNPEQAQSSGQAAGETSAASSTQAATGATAEAAPTPEPTAPASAPAGAAGGTEPTGSG